MDIVSFFQVHPWWSLYIFVNALTFILMGVDKALARAHLFRIPERVLLALSICFGALGMVLGMFIFHHKTRKGKFRYGGIILVIIQGIIIYFLLTTNWNTVF